MSAIASTCPTCDSKFGLLTRRRTCLICSSIRCSSCMKKSVKHPQDGIASFAMAASSPIIPKPLSSANGGDRLCEVCYIIDREVKLTHGGVKSKEDASFEIGKLNVRQLKDFARIAKVDVSVCVEKQEMTNLLIETILQFITTMRRDQQDGQAYRPNRQSRPTSTHRQSLSPTSVFRGTLGDAVNGIGELIGGIFSDNIGEQCERERQRQFQREQRRQQHEPDERPRRQRVQETRGEEQPYRDDESTEERDVDSTSNSHPQRDASTEEQQQRAPERVVNLEDIHTEKDLEELSVRQMKALLSKNLVNLSGCLEKADLRERVRFLWSNTQFNRINREESSENPLSEVSGDHDCKICMDATADCVFLNCGHLVTCIECARNLADCPICRSYIVKKVHVFKC